MRVAHPFRMSNTTNPFAYAPADAITNLMYFLMPKDDGGGNAVFEQKAQALLTALILVLCALRDANKSLPLTDMSDIKGINKSAGYFGNTLASLSGMSLARASEPGHLFNVSTGEVDMHDCLFNRRILVGILPSLEKSPQECENLGKIILASIKNAVSGGLGTRLEGRSSEVADDSPTSSDTPGIIIVDEYAAIMMPGFEIILTQARSLGFMAIIASQDYSGIGSRQRRQGPQVLRPDYREHCR